MRNFKLIDAKPGNYRTEDQHGHHDEINSRDSQWLNEKAHQPARKIAQQSHQTHPAGSGAALFGGDEVRDQRGVWRGRHVIEQLNN